MRTEQEFLAMVEDKIKIQETKKQIPVRIALVAAAALLVSTALLAGTAAMRQTAPPDTERTPVTVIPPAPEVTTPMTEPAIDTEIVAAASNAPYAPHVLTQPAPESGHTPETEIAPETLPGQMGIFLPAARTYRGALYLPVYASVLPLTQEDIGVQIPDSLDGLDGLTDRIYTMRGISEDYFLLVDADGLRGLVNYNYRPANLGEMITALNFEKELEFGSVYTSEVIDGQYRLWQIDGLDAAELWALLFSMPESIPERLTYQIDIEAIQREAEAAGAAVAPPYDPIRQYIAERSFPADISVSISLPRLGIVNHSIMISREGWLWTNLLSSGAYFAVSPTLCDDILVYARQAGEWTDMTPIAPSVEVPETTSEIYFSPVDTVTWTSTAVSAPPETP